MNIGDRVWVPHDDHAWLAGRIISLHTASGIEVDTEIGRLTIKKADASKIEICGSHIDQNIENLVDLDEMSEGAILHHIRKRYKSKKIYTHVGAILVAANPFEKLDLYGKFVSLN